ncbi:MAG: type VI secretion system tip protein TssI/VgrG [Gemmatimonadota bacterium]
MPTYSQANRPMRVDTVLGTDVLLLAGLSGVEGVSMPFGFHLDLLSEDPAVRAEDVLRTPVTLTLRLPEGEERRIHGLVSRFVQLGQADELTSYRAEVVPWLWFLSLSRDCRIFQNLSVLEIVEQVFRAQGYSDFQVRCTRGYPKREYCVQYRETHLDFVSRLLEEEGIFYFFEHSESRHVLTLADSNGSVPPCPGFAKARMAAQSTLDEDVVTELRREHSVFVGTVTLRDYDYLQPSLSLESSMSGDGREEVYDYPGNYTTLDEGERYARIQLEAEEALRQTVQGKGLCRYFQSGCRFDLSDHYVGAANQAYLLLRVHHSGSGGDYRSWDSAPVDYHNEFLAIPHDVPFRPARKTPTPVVRGSQTALVVGPAGEEVWVDRHGRIKVQFPWDRTGRRDENSSCWVRVAQPWAGKGWGAVQIPRIGNEVIVEFLEGDPDRPIVTGSVYNAEQTPPFALPGAGIQMGMKSRSSPGGGGYNEITMTDTKGREMLNVHAQYDMVTRVEHDDTQTVVNDRTIGVTGNHTETIQKDCTLTVNGKHTETVRGNTGITISEGDYTHDVATGTATLHVKGAVAESFDDTLTTTVNKGITITSSTARITLEASTEIVLHTGSSMISMKSDGTISISGTSVSITGTREVKAGVGTQTVTCNPQQVQLSGAGINAAAVGVHEISGALIKIN